MAKGKTQAKASSASSITSITYWRKFGTHRLIYIGLTVIFALSIVVYFAPGGGPGPGATANAADAEVIATVDGEEITAGDFRSTWEGVGRAMGGGDAQEVSLQGMVLEQLTNAAMIRAEAKRRNIQVSDADIDKQIEDLRKQMGTEKEPASEEELLMRSRATSMRELRERLREGLIPNALGQQVSNAAALTEQDLLKTYDQLKLRHILVAVNTSPRPAPKSLPDEQAKRRAEQILEQLKAGKDFAALANEYSDDPSNRPMRFDEKLQKQVSAGPPKGGDLGWSPAEGGGYAKEFAEAAKKLKKGEISGIVKTEFGYHIIRLDETKRELPKDYAKEKITLLEQFKNQKASEAVRKILDEKKKTAKIVWKSPYYEWRFQYAKLMGFGGMSSMNVLGSENDKEKTEFAEMLRKYVKSNPDDSAAGLVLGGMLHQRYIMSNLPANIPNLPKNQKKPSKEEAAALRKELIEVYSAALSKSEDTEAQFTLAGLLKEDGQKDEALKRYEQIHRYSKWDTDPEDKFIHTRLEAIFKEMGKPELAKLEAAKLVEIKKIEDEREAERKAEEAKQRAAEEKSKAEQAKKNSAASKPDTPPSDRPVDASSSGASQRPKRP